MKTTDPPSDRRQQDGAHQLENAVPISGRQAPPCTLVIFGAAGDLTQRKLVPALYNLARQRLVTPSGFAVIGFARREYSDEQFRAYLEGELGGHVGGSVDPAIWGWLSERAHYVVGTPAAAQRASVVA